MPRPAGTAGQASSGTRRDTELKIATGFLDQQTEKYKAANHNNPTGDALTDLCQALLASSEFVYRP